MNKPLPTGTVTFLFTDIQGSTPLWEQHPQEMATALQIHNTALCRAIEANGGVIFKTVGDAFQAAFSTAPQALKAAIDGQRALQSATWNELGPLSVRMGLHTGEAELDPGGDEYAVSHAKNRIGRIHSVAHGGQILLSQETADLVMRTLPEGVTLKDLGEHRLKGMEWLEHLYQVNAPGLPQEFPPLVTATTHPNNLPVQRTSFIGRQAQVIQVKELIKQHALVTLTGSGGVGKTRLSLQVAQELVEQYADGVWLVELAPVSDPEMVVHAVAEPLGLKSMTSQPLHEILLEYLANRQVLIVLDNCEHLLEACAALVDELLRICPRVKILASSRESLGVTGEIPYRVPSLSLPTPSHLPDVAELAQFEAVRLFDERARLARPDFQVTAQNAPAVAQICQRLDGVPLAIELAAARLAVLTSEQLQQQLQKAFRVLTGGSRTALPRQQTLRATIDWSYRLLSENEKKLLRRLAAFVGSFDLPAVETVCCLEDAEKFETLDLLTSLANKSMLTVERQPGLEMRYRLLETVRQYAREKLDDSGESEHLHERHAMYYLDLAQQGGRNTFTRHAPVWLRRLDTDFSNIRAAFNWALEGPDAGKAIQALNTLGWYWLSRCNLDEGYHWMEKALQRMDHQVPSIEQAELLCNLGLVAIVRPLSVDERQCLLRSREMFQALGDRKGYACATEYLAVTYYDDDWKLNARYHAESVSILRQLGDDEALALAIWMWGHNSRDSGDLDLGERLLRESEGLYRKLGSWKLGDVYYNLGHLYALKGQTLEARSLFSQALPILHEVNDQWGIMFCKRFMGEMELKAAADRPGFLLAQRLLLDSLEISQKLGRADYHNWYMPILLAKIEHKLGENSGAVRWYRESLSVLQEFYMKEGDIGWTSGYIGECLLGLAQVEANLDHLTRSARLLGALEGLRQANPILWKSVTQADFEHVTQAVQALLGEADFTRAYIAGSGMTLEQAVAYALEEHE